MLTRHTEAPEALHPPGPLVATLRALGAALGLLVAITAIGVALRPFLAEADLVMLYLGGVVVVSYVASWRLALLVALTAVALFDFFFVEPLYTFDISDARYLVTFSVMAMTGVAVSALATRLRRQRLGAESARIEAEAERLRNAVLSSVSHDLRTPLGSILGGATTLLDRPDLPTDQRNELTRSIEEQARRLGRQLDNLLQMIRVEGGALRLRREWLPPEELIGSALHTLGAPSESVRFRLNGPELVDVDAGAIEAALANLLSNALAQCDDVQVECGGVDHWEVRVLDHGPGFDPGDLPHVFEKFHRGRNAHLGGSGLGLAIVSAMVEAHGGEVWVNNRAGGGAEVGFSIPIGEAPGEIPEAA